MLKLEYEVPNTTGFLQFNQTVTGLTTYELASQLMTRQIEKSDWNENNLTIKYSEDSSNQKREQIFYVLDRNLNRDVYEKVLQQVKEHYLTLNSNLKFKVLSMLGQI